MPQVPVAFEGELFYKFYRDGDSGLSPGDSLQLPYPHEEIERALSFLNTRRINLNVRQVLAQRQCFQSDEEDPRLKLFK